jgi:hypothetical protein
MSHPIPAESSGPPLATILSEVRYSLPAMLKEIEVERRESGFSMEILDQVEIGKMFVNKRRRVRTKK